MSKENASTIPSAKAVDRSASGSPSSGEIAVIEWAARKFAVVKTNVNGFQILRCKHEGISGGLQLIYTTRKKAEEVAAWIRENSEAIIPENAEASQKQGD